MNSTSEHRIRYLEDGERFFRCDSIYPIIHDKLEVMLTMRQPGLTSGSISLFGSRRPRQAVIRGSFGAAHTLWHVGTCPRLFRHFFRPIECYLGCVNTTSAPHPLTSPPSTPRGPRTPGTFPCPPSHATGAIKTPVRIPTERTPIAALNCRSLPPAVFSFNIANDITSPPSCPQHAVFAFSGRQVQGAVSAEAKAPPKKRKKGKKLPSPCG